MSAVSSWRVEDERLLARLEDERILAALFRLHTAACTPPASPPPARAAGMIALLCEGEDGPRVRARALEGDLAPLAERLTRFTARDAAPALLHHLALYMARVAAATEEAAPARSIDAAVRALGAWLGLARERRYLTELARAVLGEDEADRDRERLIADVRDDAIDALGRRAEAGARAGTLAAAAALGTLARVGEACDAAGLAGDEHERLERRAGALRDAAIELALTPVNDALAEASARGQVTARAPAILADVPRIWRWSAEDEAVERFLVDRITDVAWDLYRGARWDELRALLVPFDVLVESLCLRIERGDGVAYRAPCAQMLVFRSEVASTLADQLALAERALRLCPGHKNTKIVLASYLCHDAMRRMNRPYVLTRPEERAAIGALLDRAEALNRSSRTLAEAKASYARWPG